MATPTRVQTLRSSVKGQRPTTGTREPGELYVSFPDRQFGVIDAGKAALDMIPVRYFSPNTDYVTGDFVFQAGNIYRAKAAVPAGTFNPAQWDKGAGTPADLLATLLTVDGTGSGLDADLLDGHDSPYFAVQSDMTAVQNKNTAQDSAIALKLDASAYTAADVLAKIKTVDGPGSGLDADLLDGLSSADFMQAGSGYTKSQSDLLYVNVLGDSMTGDLLLPGTAPSSSTAAAPKSYVDAQVATKLSDAPNDGLTYGRKSAAWATIVGGAVVSDTAPAGPLQAGQLWWESDSGNTFIWYNDGDTSQWVQQNVPPADAAIAVTNIVVTMITTLGAGSYIKPANLKLLEVTCVGGGGGSQSSSATTATTSCGGAGGAGAGTCIKLYKASDLAASEPYTVGAGGAISTDGGPTIFKGMTASGGTGALTIAAGGTTFTASPRVTGGTATGGDININGGDSDSGMRCVHGTLFGYAGGGGASFFAGNQAGIYNGTTAPGVVGRFPGGGARGTCNGANQSTTASGAKGGDGCIILKEYF